MKITTQLRLERFIRLQYAIVYGKVSILWITLVGLIAIGVTVFNLLNGGQVGNSWFGFALGLYVVFLPFWIYRSAIKNFNSTAILQQPIDYDFQGDKLIIDSAVSHAEIPWDNVYQVKELKQWFLLYQNATVANIIDKSTLSNYEVQQIRYILQNAPVKKKKLKR